MEAKKQGTGEEDLSMEEILQSIRRIIADDSEEGKAAAAVNGSAQGGSADASPILELTDMIEDDGSITNLKEPPKEAEKNVDVLSNIDAALAKDVPPEPVAEKKPDPTAPAQPAAPAKAAEAPVPQKPVAAVPVPEKAPENMEVDALLSKTAQEAALSSLSKLDIPEEKPVYKPTTPSPEFRSGTTVEDMVEDMIRPMLKEWLDANLPTIVERIVEREVTRLSRR